MHLAKSIGIEDVIVEQTDKNPCTWEFFCSGWADIDDKQDKCKS